jgi:hypothetical protein
MIPTLSQIAPPTPSAENVWLVVVTLITAGSSLATIGLWWQGRQRQDAAGNLTSLSPAEAAIVKPDFDKHLDSNRREFDRIWATVRDENTAIRHEITEAVQHSQEMLMDKLEKNRRELSDKLDTIPSRIIADLSNAKELLD